MKVSVENEDIHAETVVIKCSKAEYAAMKYYAEYYARRRPDAAQNAATRFPGSSSLFSFDSDFQDKLFR